MSTLISSVQRALHVSESGFLDSTTQSAIKNFQMRVSLRPTGELDDNTIKKLKTHASLNISETADTTAIGTYEMNPNEIDYNESMNYTSDMFETLYTNNIDIKKRYLDADEYVNEYTPKSMIFLHHTAGWNDPYHTIKWWNDDARGRIATEFVIGGINFETDEAKHDGVIVQAFPEGNWAYHLGGAKRHGITSKMVKESVGIEICNFGWLTERYGKYYTYTGNEVPSKYVTKLDKPFRGYEYWHSYTDKQLKSLEGLIKHLGRKYNIDITRGIKEELAIGFDKHHAFEYKDSFMLYPAPGLYSHTNVRKDKSDVYPHPKLISMLENLYY